MSGICGPPRVWPAPDQVTPSPLRDHSTVWQDTEHCSHSGQLHRHPCQAVQHGWAAALLSLAGKASAQVQSCTTWLLGTTAPFGNCHGHQDPSKVTETTGGNINSREEKKQSKSQQLKKTFQKYGALGVSLHTGISLISLGMFYMVVSSSAGMSAILLKLGFKESLVQSKMAAGTSAFVVA
ncbi:hypothetical protein AB1E19_010302 [Capra hircus]